MGFLTFLLHNLIIQIPLLRRYLSWLLTLAVGSGVKLLLLLQDVAQVHLFLILLVAILYHEVVVWLLAAG